jgi:hypothetical protein
VETLLRRAESILDVAGISENPEGAAILLDREGGMRMMSLDGWSLPGLISEFGAHEVYSVRRVADTVVVEGWSPREQCTLRRQIARRTLPGNSHHLITDGSPSFRLIERSAAPGMELACIESDY